ncbi:MBL fold metallo-hydrolase [Novosphingobium sp.]|uniref:MBL fold metallo-hydrolase n=1 Tax=Novosphingobium sp. TaxID=1874826 RepID=UPI00286A7B40|nr:MBL fold metallo-hydrolase [Novosphingobium sp.]
MTHRLNLVLLALALLLGGPFYWLLIDNHHAPAPAHRIDIAALRQLAASQAGAAPSGVEVECAGFRRVPGNLMVAGSGIKRKLVCYMAFRLPVPGGKPVMIESGITAADASTGGAERFNANNQARIEAELDLAGLILVTHEHADHLGALAAHGGPALMDKTLLNPAQLPPSPFAARLEWKAGQVPPARLPGNRLVVVAPGVVVIPAPGSHTPGAQMIFVRTGDGREFLFVGDISSFAQNWQEQRGRSRLVQLFFAPENRAEVFGWLAAIRDLKALVPALVVVPGHDFEWLLDPKNNGGMVIGFAHRGS